MEDMKQAVFPMNGLRICIDRNGCEPEGRIYSKMSRDGLPFRNLGELLLKSDRLFDSRGYPQTFQEKRSFAREPAWSGRYGRPETERSDEDILSQRGEYCTLDAIVNSRRRASWQGVLVGRGSSRREFRSEKELLKLIMEEINKGTEPEGGSPIT